MVEPKLMRKTTRGLRQAEALQSALFRTRGAEWQGFLRRFLVWLVLAAAGASSAPVHPCPPWHGWLAAGLLAAALVWAVVAAVSLLRGGKRLQAILLLFVGYLSAESALLMHATRIYGER